MVASQSHLHCGIDPSTHDKTNAFEKHSDVIVFSIIQSINNNVLIIINSGWSGWSDILCVGPIHASDETITGRSLGSQTMVLRRHPHLCDLESHLAAPKASKWLELSNDRRGENIQ